MLFARGRLKHTYPHSWRSKKPIIFRNTPQWFAYMDKELNGFGLDPPKAASPTGRRPVRPPPRSEAAQAATA